jgi:hypothetical protein
MIAKSSNNWCDVVWSGELGLHHYLFSKWPSFGVFVLKVHNKSWNQIVTFRTNLKMGKFM